MPEFIVNVWEFVARHPTESGLVGIVGLVVAWAAGVHHREDA